MIFLNEFLVVLSGRLMSIERNNIILKCTSSFSIVCIILALLLLSFEYFVVYTSKVVVVELNMLQF